jgi:NAD(P)H-binding
MKVALTGATGFVGSHMLTELHKRGHEVMALVRNDAEADTVATAGAPLAVVDLYDRPAVVQLRRRSSGRTAELVTAPTHAPDGSIRTAVLWGLVVGVMTLVVAPLFWWLDLSVAHALGITLIAAVYIGFAVADGRPKVILIEAVVVSLFVVVAAAAVTERRGCS